MRFRIFGKLFTVPRKAVYIICAVLVLAAIIIGRAVGRKDEPDKNVFAEITPVPEREVNEPEKEFISVYIIGCVKNPGVYCIENDKVLNEAVLIAGGFTEEADREAVNLAAKMYDGMMIRIPSVNDEDKTYIMSGQTSEKAGLSEGGKVNINTADAATLMTLPGIGEATAKKIIAYREENGKFESIESIMMVPGIKEAKYSSIKNHIVV